MRKRILWAVLAAVVLVLLFVYWSGSVARDRITTPADAGAIARDEPRTEIPALPIEVVSPDAPELPIVPELTLPKEPRRDDQLAAGVVGRGSGAYTFTLDVAVVDGFDHPLAGAAVYVGPALHRLDVAGVTDGAGRLKVVWHGHLPDMDAALAVAGPRTTWSGLFRVGLTTEVPIELRLALPGERRFEDPAELEERLAQRFRMREWSDIEEGIRDAVRGALPLALARAPSIVSVGNERLFVADPAGSAKDALDGFLASWGELRRQRELGKATPVSSTHGDGARLVGDVLDAFGRPAAGALVAIGEEPDSGLYGVYADDAGRFELDDVRAGTWYVRAGGGEQGRASSFGTVFFGETVAWDFVLDTGLEVVGELLDAVGAPLANAWIELVGTVRDSSWNDFARTGEDGRFAFPNIGDGELELRAHSALEPWGLPSLVAAVDGESRFSGLREPGLAPAALTLRFPEVDGRVDEDEEDVVEARVWQLETQRGVFAHPIRDRSARLSLPPGAYLIELGSAQRGWTQRQVLLAPGESQVVEPRLPPGGSVSWIDERRRKALDYRLIELREDVNSVVATFADRLPPRFLLPAGEYELLAFERGVATLAIPFRVEDGRETVLTLVAQ